MALDTACTDTSLSCAAREKLPNRTTAQKYCNCLMFTTASYR